MTGEIVFVMIIVGIVGIAVICMGKIREKEKREKEASIQSLSAQERGIGEKAEIGMEELKEKLLWSEQKLWEMKANDGYEVLFHKIVMPLQVLLGLSEISLDTLPKEQIVYYIRDVVADPIVQAVERAQGKVTDKKLMLPLEKGRFDREEIKRGMERFEKSELEKQLQKNEQRISMGTIVFQKVGVVQGLGSVLEELKEIKQKDLVGEEAIQKLGRNIWNLLEENKIYPMFASDKRLVSYPQLRGRYIPLNENSIRYPGLFIKRNGELEVFGSNVGMDDCGV